MRKITTTPAAVPKTKRMHGMNMSVVTACGVVLAAISAESAGGNM